jgi:hypothetical protein
MGKIFKYGPYWLKWMMWVSNFAEINTCIEETDFQWFIIPFAYRMTSLTLAVIISVGGMTLRLRDPESPVKTLPLSPRRLDTPQSPRDISTSLTEIPTFCPTEEEFQRPLQYIQSIAPRAEPFGMCKIIPPSSWKVKTMQRVSKNNQSE